MGSWDIAVDLMRVKGRLQGRSRPPSSSTPVLPDLPIAGLRPLSLEPHVRATLTLSVNVVTAERPQNSTSMPPNPSAYAGYQYHAMSTLVTTADRPRHRENEPTGEAESLVGRINPKEMGARAFREDLNVEERRKKADKERERRERKEVEGGARKSGRSTVAGGMRYGDVLEATQDRELRAFTFLLPSNGD